MSIAEFYIDNGLDPMDPYHMDKFLRRYEYSYSTGYAVVLDEDVSQRRAANAYVLNQSELDYMAETRGWEILDTSRSEASMASYRKDGTRLNFWLTTGTVGSYLDHPRQGKTQLFRRQIGMSQASEIFNNPRQHTGAGYHTKKENQQRPTKDPPPRKRDCRRKHEAAAVQLSCDR